MIHFSKIQVVVTFVQVQEMQEWAPALEILKIKVVNLLVGREGTMATQWFASSPTKRFPLPHLYIRITRLPTLTLTTHKRRL